MIAIPLFLGQRRRPVLLRVKFSLVKSICGDGTAIRVFDCDALDTKAKIFSVLSGAGRVIIAGPIDFLCGDSAVLHDAVQIQIAPVCSLSAAILSSSSFGMRIGLSGIEQFLHRNAQRGGDLVDVEQADVSFASFDTADIRPVEITGQRERFLGKPFLLSEVSYSITEVLLNPGFAPPIHPNTMRITMDDDTSTDFTYHLCVFGRPIAAALPASRPAPCSSAPHP